MMGRSNQRCLSQGRRISVEKPISKWAWFVKTRAYPVQPYFESGYPFGRNQWISAAGAGWASLAIANTLPDVAPDRSPGP